MDKFRLALSIVVLFAGCARGSAAERDFHVGCMGIQSFSAWSDVQVFPYRAFAQRRSGIRKGYKRVELGTGLDRVKAEMPPPDWAVETRQGCVWKFVLRVSDAKEAIKYKGVTLGFREAQVVRLGQENSPWEVVEH